MFASEKEFNSANVKNPAELVSLDWILSISNLDIRKKMSPLELFYPINMKKKIFEIILGALMAFVIFFIAELLIVQNIHNKTDIATILKNIPWPGIGLTGVILIIITIVKGKKK